MMAGRAVPPGLARGQAGLTGASFTTRCFAAWGVRMSIRGSAGPVAQTSLRSLSGLTCHSRQNLVAGVAASLLNAS